MHTDGQPVGAGSVHASSTPARRRPKRLLVLAGGLLLILALLAVAVTASWLFSSEVLVPRRTTWPLDATVRSVSKGQVTLSRSSDTLRPGVYGIDWHGGHAIVEGVLSSGAHTVTRSLSALRGVLAPGTRVAMDPSVYQGDPQAALGLRFANVQVPDELGPMPAWLVYGHAPGWGHMPRGGHESGLGHASRLGHTPRWAHIPTWAIVVHGINSNRDDVLRFVPGLHRAGLPALVISYRDDNGAPRSPDGLHHMGLTEWQDLQAAARYALAHGARRLVLAGYSMGGSIVAQFMERSSLAPRVAALILDAPALDWKAILSFNASEMGLPSFAADPVEWMVGERIHADWNSLDALAHARDLHLPVLLFHGTADKLVPISTSDAFARELGPRFVTYYRVPGAAHVQSWNAGPLLYEERVDAFLAHAGLAPPS